MTERPTYVFVTGGVASGLGKGITAASIGRLLKSRGFRVTHQKLDPYINVDPGTMNPFEHGEVFVLDDGAETDLDLGHYERFTDESLHKGASVTAGSVYQSVIAKERRGDYLGKTVQVIPHITNEIKDRIRSYAESEAADVAVVEVGGTVGDIESLPFLEAIRQFRNEVGRDKVAFVHVALTPFIGPTQELKTKPVQHSVRELRSIGIQPDAIVCRSDRPISQHLRDKISLLCDVEARAVISAHDADSIYEVPLILHAEGLDSYLIHLLGLPDAAPDLAGWSGMVDRIRGAGRPLDVAIVGKYVNLHDAYLSVTEALGHAGALNGAKVRVRWYASDELIEDGAAAAALEGADAILVPGGFGVRGVEGKVEAIRIARERGIPFLGLCLGLQCAVIEFARNACGLVDANSSEFEPNTPHPVIDLLPEQHGVIEMGGTMRLGKYRCDLIPGTAAAAAYSLDHVDERHRHRYEVNPEYHDVLQANGMVFSGMSPDRRLVEIIELTGHPFFMAGQFHPELRSRPGPAHPMFREFVRAAVERRYPSVEQPELGAAVHAAGAFHSG